MATTLEQITSLYGLPLSSDNVTQGKLTLGFIYGNLLNLNSSTFSPKNVEKFNKLVFALPSYNMNFGLTSYFKLSNGCTVEVALQSLRESAQCYLEGLKEKLYDHPERLYPSEIASPAAKEKITLIRDNLIAEIIRYPPLNDNLSIFVDVKNPDKDVKEILNKYSLDLSECLTLSREHGFFLK